jgi:hypothetical protein
MTFQAYLDSIKAKTGKTPDDFRALAKGKELTQYKEVLAWLKTDYGLGHGHANLIAQMVTKSEELNATADDKLAEHFKGTKAKWWDLYNALEAEIKNFGADVKLQPARSYINVQRGGKKFATLKPATVERFDIGLKLKGVASTERLEESGSWNNMVTHRVKLTDPSANDAQLLAWLRQAYDAG